VVAEDGPGRPAPYTPPKEGFYITEAFTDHAVTFSRRIWAGRQPSSSTSRTPRPTASAPWPEDIAKYQGKYRKGWDPPPRRAAAAHDRDGLDPRGVGDVAREIRKRGPGRREESGADDLKMAVYAAQLSVWTRASDGAEEDRGTWQAGQHTVMFLADNGGCAGAARPASTIARMRLPPGGLTRI
jgi:arylsulfatase